MLTTPQAILSASGQALLQPLGFSTRHRGKMLYEIPEEFWRWIARETKTDPEAYLAKVREARDYKPTNQRPTITDAAQLPADLFNHQKQFNLRFGTSSYGAAFFEVGAMKTRTILEMMRLRWQSGDKALVLCPRSVFSTWSGQTKQYAPHMTITVASGPSAQKITLLGLKRDIYVMNYQSLLNEQIVEFLLRMGITWLICDESHRVKTHNAAITKVLINLSANIEMRWLLTGTPITKSEKDIWSQSVILDRGRTFGTSFSKFYTQWFTKGEYGYYEGQLRSAREEAFKRAIESFSMRVLKKDCLDLPQVMPDMMREVELTGEALKFYKKMRDEALIVLRDQKIEAKYKIVELRRLHQICGGGIGAERFNCDKITELLDLVEEINKPVVISAIYRDEIRAIVVALKKAGKNVTYIAGDVSDKDRQERIASFSAGQLDGIVLQQQAAGTGVDGLQRASSFLIFYSWDHQWESGQQMKGRIDRQGQTDRPQYIYLKAVLPNGKETIDQAIYESHQEKTVKISELIDNVIQGAEG